MAELRPLIEKLKEERNLTHDEFVRMFTCRNPEDSEYLRSLAQETAVANYGHDIYRLPKRSSNAVISDTDLTSGPSSCRAGKI